MVYRCSIGTEMNYFSLKISSCCSKVPGHLDIEIVIMLLFVHYLLFDVLCLVLVL